MYEKHSKMSTGCHMAGWHSQKQSKMKSTKLRPQCSRSILVCFRNPYKTIKYPRLTHTSFKFGIFFNSLLTSGDFCHLLITIANSLDPEQARQNVRHDLDPNCLQFWWYFCKNILKKQIFKKKQSRRLKKHAKFPSMLCGDFFLFQKSIKQFKCFKYLLNVFKFVSIFNKKMLQNVLQFAFWII